MQRDLVVRAMRRDHEAFTELTRLAIDRLFVIARLILGDTESAEDATQEAFVAAWRDLPSLRDPDRFDLWLRRLVVRECYREARRTRTHRTVELTVELSDPGSDDPAHHLADRDEIERAFARLAPEHRAVLVLRFFADLPMEEVARSMGVPLGTAKSRLHRANQELRAILDASARSSIPPLVRRPT
jgi:RNA polymerase sigma-70 factor (ECF subfamily)